MSNEEILKEYTPVNHEVMKHSGFLEKYFMEHQVVGAMQAAREDERKKIDGTCPPKEPPKINSVIILNYTDEYWYSSQIGKEFNVTHCHHSDLRNVTGLGSKEANECWKVSGGEFDGNVILKQHCKTITP